MQQPKCSRCGAGPFANLNEWSNHDCSRPNWEQPLKAQKAPVAKLQCSDGLVDHALKKQLDRLLCVVNAVTCPHRHGQPIRPKDLTRLANRQIEVEEALREMGY